MMYAQVVRWQAAAPDVELGPGFVGRGVHKWVAQLEQHGVQGEAESIRRELPGIEPHLDPPSTALHCRRQPLDHGLPCILHYSRHSSIQASESHLNLQQLAM